MKRITNSVLRLRLMTSVIALGAAYPALAQPVTFDSGTVYQAGENATGHVAVDLDGDGDLDIATSARASDDVTLFENDGTGQFTIRDVITVNTEPRYVVSADLNGDGHADLITPGRVSGVAILFGDGAWGFTQTNVSMPNQSWLTTDDVDEDGDLDLVVLTIGSPSTLDVRKNDGNGVFTFGGVWLLEAEARSAVLRDFDNDGDRDIVVCNLIGNSIQIRYATGAGVFLTGPVLDVTGGPRYVASDDFDADGDDDLAIAFKDSDELRIYFNDGAAGFTTNPIQDTYFAHTSTHSVATADFDNDGDADLITSHVGGAMGSFVDVFLNDGTGQFTSKPLVTPVTLAHVIAADVDSDGAIDIAGTSSSGNSLTIHRNTTNDPPPCPADLTGDASVGFDDVVALLAAWGPCRGCAADFDADAMVGFSDLVSLLGSWGPCPRG